MANITRFDPFKIGSFDPFEEVFKGFFRPIRWEWEGQPQIKMDVKEDEKSYIVLAEIPGVNKEDVQVSIDGNQVSISAETKEEKEVKEGERVLRSERYYGKVSRSFSLDSDIDEANAQASYKNGVLELTLPKKTVTPARKLTIK